MNNKIISGKSAKKSIVAQEKEKILFVRTSRQLDSNDNADFELLYFLIIFGLKHIIKDEYQYANHQLKKIEHDKELLEEFNQQYAKVEKDPPESEEEESSESDLNDSEEEKETEIVLEKNDTQKSDTLESDKEQADHELQPIAEESPEPLSSIVTDQRSEAGTIVAGSVAGKQTQEQLTKEDIKARIRKKMRMQSKKSMSRKKTSHLNVL